MHSFLPLFANIPRACNAILTPLLLVFMKPLWSSRAEVSRIPKTRPQRRGRDRGEVCVMENKLGEREKELEKREIK